MTEEQIKKLKEHAEERVLSNARAFVERYQTSYDQTASTMQKNRAVAGQRQSDAMYAELKQVFKILGLDFSEFEKMHSDYVSENLYR